MLQTRRRVSRDYPALVDYRNLVAEVFRFLHDVRCEKHRQTALDVPLYIVKEHAPGGRVKAHRRLVEKKQIHVMHEFTRHLHSPPLAD